MNIVIKKSISTIFGMIIVALGLSLTIKGNVGVGAYNAMNLSISELSYIKVGTITLLMNILCLIIQYFYSSSRNYVIFGFQIFMMIILGECINFFTYNILSHFEVTSYLIQLLLFFLGTAITAVAIGFILSLDFISFPLEGACLEIAKRYSLSFTKIRYIADIIFCLLSLLLSFIFLLNINVREGTILSLILLSITINKSMKYFENKKFINVKQDNESLISNKSNDI